jgi:hypothetical protein
MDGSAMNGLIPRIDAMLYRMSHEYFGYDHGDWDEEEKLLVDCREAVVMLRRLLVENGNES